MTIRVPSSWVALAHQARFSDSAVERLDACKTLAGFVLEANEMAHERQLDEMSDVVEDAR